MGSEFPLDVLALETHRSLDPLRAAQANAAIGTIEVPRHTNTAARDRGRARWSIHSRQALRGPAQRTWQTNVPASIEDHDIDPAASVLHLTQHQAGIHGIDFHVTLALDTLFDGQEIVDTAGLFAMPGIEEKADGITSGPLDPAPHF
jgi:hypothetical protein